MHIPITYDFHSNKRKIFSGVSVVGSPEGERRGQLPQGGILNCKKKLSRSKRRERGK